MEVVVVRATSVQGVDRGTSNSLSRIASSPLASVAAPGTQSSVVSSLVGLSNFVTSAALYQNRLPAILLQPWEGASVTDVLELAGGGRRPLKIPAFLAKAGLSSLYAVSRAVPGLRGPARRLEVMWLGQDQIVGWGASQGLVPESTIAGKDPEISVSALEVSGPSDYLRTALQGRVNQDS